MEMRSSMTRQSSRARARALSRAGPGAAAAKSAASFFFFLSFFFLWGSFSDFFFFAFFFSAGGGGSSGIVAASTSVGISVGARFEMGCPRHCPAQFNLICSFA